jgi:glutathione peroxidase
MKNIQSSSGKSKSQVALNRYVLILIIFLVLGIVALVAERKLLFGSKKAQENKHYLQDHHSSYEEEENQHELKNRHLPLPILRKISVIEKLHDDDNNKNKHNNIESQKQQQQQHNTMNKNNKKDDEECVIYGPNVNFNLLDFDEETGLKPSLVDVSKEFMGKITLFVNVASKCGFTDSGYKTLVALHKWYVEENQSNHHRQFRIVAIPSNDFGKQEPGTISEIRHFAKEKYGANFHIYGKETVVGNQASPLFQQLTKCSPSRGASSVDEPVTWNFNFFLVNPIGKVVARFPPGTPAGIIMKVIDPLMG